MPAWRLNSHLFHIYRLYLSYYQRNIAMGLSTACMENYKKYWGAPSQVCPIPYELVAIYKVIC